ncbi:RHS repeat-associated core domain-containing protein [Streptomyces sp. NPDC059070]|uniref:RHS repeat-associated core domain-containing protein n=1 Tax=Streptomyces sp. NPDC059070 TaxID=3346713 RepID=UPI0036C2D413
MLSLAAALLSPAIPQAAAASGPDFDRVWSPPGTTLPKTPSTGATSPTRPTAPRPHYPVPERSAAQPAPRLSAAALKASAGGRAVTVTRADDKAATAAGVHGTLFALRTAPAPHGTAADGSTGLRLTLDQAALNAATGGDFASRGRLVALPGCALTTPQVAACRVRTPVATGRDSATGALTARLDTARTAATGAGLAASAPATVALAAETTPSGGGGSYTATSLAPSSAWAAGGASGAFTYAYNLAVPPALGGPAPQVSLAYDSSTVDGRTSATNAQASWIGDGWDFNPGFIERSYQPCDKAGIKNAGDLCWGGFNAVLSLGSHGGQLVRADSAPVTSDDATGVWRLKNDDGTRVEFASGARNGTDSGSYAKVTDSGGTVYYFGLGHLPGGDRTDPATNSASTVPVYAPHSGAPCYDAAKGNRSWCRMWQRLSLDYVVDAHGNLTTFTWAPETGYYARGAVQDNGAGTPTAYTRANNVAQIAYGQRLDDQIAAKGALQPAARVTFTPLERCETPATGCDPATRTVANKANWPDVPVDQECKESGTCTTYSPTYFTTKRLSSVTTQVRVGNVWQDVDAYAFSHSFPNPSDSTSQKALWLDSVKHTGRTGAELSTPAVTFTPVMLPNRVDGTDLVPAPPRINRPRIQQIRNETGAVVNVDYNLPGCSRINHVMPAAEDDDAMACYPVRWNVPGQVAGADPVLDWFNHYSVKSLTENDPVTGAPQKTTSYEYGPAAWHRDDSELTDAKARTWGEFRGFASVTARTGSGSDGPRSQTRTTYRQGMHGDVRGNGTARDVRSTDPLGHEVVDVDWLSGQVLATETYDRADGTVTARTVTTPSDDHPTATHVRGGSLPDLVARYPATTVVVTGQEKKADDSWRTTSTTTVTDPAHNNRVKTALSRADGLPDLCTRSAYASGPDAQRTDLPTEKLVVSATSSDACTDTAGTANTVERTRTFYDGKPYGQSGAPGDVTRTETVDGYAPDGTAAFVPTAVTGYDAYGRTVSATDPNAKDAQHPDGSTTTTAYTAAATGELPNKVTVSNPVPGAAASEHWDAVTVTDPRRGLPLKSTDVNLKTTTETYDALGRLTGVWLPGRAPDSDPTPNVGFDYQVSNQTGVPSTVTTSRLTKDGDTPVLTRQIQLLDGFGRVRQTQESPKNPAYKGRLVSDTVYDSQGRVALTNPPWYNNTTGPAQSLVTAADSTLAAQTRTTYDGRGRTLTTASWSLGVEQTRTTTSYRGADRTDVVPPTGGAPTTTLSDARGHTTELWQYTTPTATGSALDATISRYTYSADGKPLTRQDAAGNTWSIGYDLHGRQTGYQEPDKGTTSQTWDAAGHLASGTDARGKTLKYTYDLLGRRTGLYEESADPAHRLAAWSYDTVPDGRGKPAGSTRYTGGEGGSAYTTTVDGYDDAYRPTGSTLTLPGGDVGQEPGTTFSYSTTTSYDPLTGTASGMVLPAVGGLPMDDIAYALNDYGQMFRYMGATTYDVQSEYDAFGRTVRSTVNPWGKQVVSTTDYDQATGRVRAQYVDQQTSGTGALQQTGYTYDPSGRITSITNVPDNKPALTDRQCFAYDAFSRLTSAWTDTKGLTLPADSEHRTPDQGRCTTAQPSAATVGGPAAYWQEYGYDVTGNRTKLVKHDPAGDTAKDVTVTQAFGTPGTRNAPTAAPGTGGGTGGPHALLSAAAKTGPATTTDLYQYDAGGNTTSYQDGRAGTSVLTWNSEGKPASTTTSAPIRSGLGKCLGTDGAATADDTALTLATCDDSAATQKYSATGDRLTTAGKCVTAIGTLPGAPVRLRPCDGTAAQTWTRRTDGTLYNTVAARCLTVPGGATADGTKLALGDCLLAVPAGQKWTVPDTTTTYLYDTEGKLLLRRGPATTTLNLGADELNVDRATGARTGVRSYPVPGGMTVVRTGAGTAAGAFAVQIADHHGSANLTVDLAGGGVTRQALDPFGNPRGAAPASWPGDKGFVGGQKDTATGLTLLGARQYQPSTGRFISADPLLDPNAPQQWNGYAYSDNNPVNGSDPDGTFCDGCSVDNPDSVWTHSGPGCTNSACYSDDGKTVLYSTVPVKKVFGPYNPCPYCKPKPKPDPCPFCVKKPSSGPHDRGPGPWAPDPRPATDDDPPLPKSNKILPIKHAYTHVEEVGSSKWGSPEKLMSTFQQSPQTFFPFPVEGCSSFTEGAVCRLFPGKDTPGGVGMILGGNGLVRVHVDKTSTSFTVISENYFDDPGSVITFTTSEKNGKLYMTQRGVSEGSNLGTVFAVKVLGQADNTWWQMGQNFRNYISPPMTQSRLYWLNFHIPGLF